MDIKLVVVRAFGPHARGALIEDSDAVAQILASENAACVVRVLAEPAEPAQPTREG